MGAPPPRWAPDCPGTPPAPSEDEERSETDGVTPGYVYINSPLPRGECFNLYHYGKDRIHDKHCISDLLTHDGPYTCWHTNSCVVMQLTAILITRAAY